LDGGTVTQQDRATFTAWLGNPDVPGILRLWAYLGSTELARANQVGLTAIVANPGAAPSMYEPTRRVQAQEALRWHPARLRNAAPALDGVLGRVEAVLKAWIDARRPAVR
jgi:hypothetical protein